MDINAEIQKMQAVADAELGAGVVQVKLEQRTQVVAEVVDGQVVDMLDGVGQPLTCVVSSIRIKIGKGVSTAFDLAPGKGDHRIDQRPTLTPGEMHAEFRRQLGHFVREHHDRAVLGAHAPEEREKIIVARRRADLARAAEIQRENARAVAERQAAADAAAAPRAELPHDLPELAAAAVRLGAMSPEEHDESAADRAAAMAKREGR